MLTYLRDALATPWRRSASCINRKFFVAAERSYRPRFSILSALLVLTIAALAVTVWRQNSEISPLQQEIRRLRQELGQLTIDDEN